MKLIPLLVLLALVGCTSTERQTATQVASAVELGCIVVVSVAAPGEQGLCVGGDELVNATIALIGQVTEAKETVDGKTVIDAKVFAKLATDPRIKARRFSRTRPCPAGSVAP